MPSASHPQAQFVPINPDLDLDALVDNTSNFDYVTRLPCEILKEHSIQHLEQLILLHVVIGGKPLVIENWDGVLDPNLFSAAWLQEHVGKKAESVRDIPNALNIPMTIGHYLKSMPQLAKQFTASNYRDPKRQRLYLKDIDCPEEWAGYLQDILPETFFYLNECIEPRSGGDGAILEANEYGQMKYGKGVAPAGDLMSSLPPEMRAMNMMCYIGHEGTYTPAHREMCASLGHNVMVEASQDGNGEKAGSSIWFMTETKEREVVSEYFLSMLGHDIEVEKHFAQINAWKKAPFNVWVVEQKPGDLILIPPLAPHQVWNRGTRTMKAAWNRTTIDTLELALHEALPRARLVCREEQYKNKAIIYYTLIKYHKLLQRDTIEPKMWKYGRIKQVLEDFKRLFSLYTEIVVSEMFASTLPSEQNVELLPYDSNVTCAYCRCNIFNRFLTCKTCIETLPDGEEDAYDICMECYAMGRSCGCISNLKWVEQWEWSVLTGNYEEWRNVIVQCDGYFDLQKSPQPLDSARKKYGRKPVAQVCQEQLKMRPWHDISKPFVPDPSPGMSDVEPEADDSGRPKKKTPQKPKNGRVPRVKNKTYACHICCHHDWNWRLAFCTTCTNAYCYGVLWRAFDLMPQTVMEDRDWTCPKCQGICSCGKCRKNPNQKPYAPKGTLLGHDTKKVADVRSVESLVDFSRTNLTWLRGENDHDPHESARMKRLKEKAEEAKAREDVIDEKYIDSNIDPAPAPHPIAEDDGHIDPLLRDHAMPVSPEATGDVHYESIYSSTILSPNEADHIPFTIPDAIGWPDSKNLLDDRFDLSKRQETSYPSAMLGLPVIEHAVSSTAPEEPVSEPLAPEQPPSEQHHLLQNRMMGIGFYEQDNGVDKILYDPPDTDAANGTSSIAAATNTNLALSDLLQPAPDSEVSKKRKNGHEKDDTEFFTSKRQKKLAEMNVSKVVFENRPPDHDVPKSMSAQRPSRASSGKQQVYLDVDEDDVPVSDSEIIVVKPRSPKQAVDGARRPTRDPRPKRSSEPFPRQSTRQKASSGTALQARTASTKRRSAWLARKEAEEASASLSSTSRRTRTKPVPKRADTQTDKEAENDDLFSDHDNDAAQTEKRAAALTRKDTPKAVPRGRPPSRRQTKFNDEPAAKPMPRPRGRPRKSDSMTPKPSAVPQLLSLKEKMALKGRSAKIVSSRTRTSAQKSMSAPKEVDTMSSIEVAITQTVPMARDTNEENDMQDSRLKSRSEDITTHPTSDKASEEKSAASVATELEPIRKGPTVVRLPSFSSDSHQMSSSDNDSSIPAIKSNRN